MNHNSSRQDENIDISTESDSTSSDISPVDSNGCTAKIENPVVVDIIDDKKISEHYASVFRELPPAPVLRRQKTIQIQHVKKETVNTAVTQSHLTLADKMAHELWIAIKLNRDVSHNLRASDIRFQALSDDIVDEMAIRTAIVTYMKSNVKD